MRLLPDEWSEYTMLGTTGVVAQKFFEHRSYGRTYWCFPTALLNNGGVQLDYNTLEYGLLTSTGSIDYPAIPIGAPDGPLLGAGALAAQGTTEGLVCFDEPISTSGRFALIYAPTAARYSPTVTGDVRALFYFDR